MLVTSVRRLKFCTQMNADKHRFFKLVTSNFVRKINQICVYPENLCTNKNAELMLLYKKLSPGGRITWRG